MTRYETGRLQAWLVARPHRFTILNILMLSAVLAMLRMAPLFSVVGGAMVLLATLYYLVGAGKKTLLSRHDRNFYQLSLIWLPGALAITLAVTGLTLVTADAPSNLSYCLGSMLFAAEVAMLALAGIDLSPTSSA